MRYALLACTPLLTCFTSAVAQPCFSTAEAAAQSIVGTPRTEIATTSAGYRVQDLQMDPLTRHLWVRLRRCDNDAAPLVLVPVQASLAGLDAGNSNAPVAFLTQPGTPSPLPSAPPAARILAVHAGDAVLITFASSAVQMEIEGTAEQAAALGETVGVLLRRRGDEPAHRMRGTLRADHHVEVQ